MVDVEKMMCYTYWRLLRSFFGRKGKIMKKKLLYTVLVMSLAATLAACGKKKKIEITTEAAPTTATATEAVREPAKDADGFVVTNDYVETTVDSVKIRLTPKPDADVYVMVPLGELLQRTGYNDSWTRVLYDDTNFYVSSAEVTLSDGKKTTEEDASLDDVTLATSSDADLLARSLPKKIVIDPGNQSVLNTTLEAVAPGSEEQKQAVSQGDTGVLGTKEYDINLVYAKMLEAELTGRGYTVILTRDSNDVDMTNKERAELANSSGASAFLRIQMNYSSNPSIAGAMTFCMPEYSESNGELYVESHAFATWVLKGLTESTGCNNRGIYETTRMTAVNWSEIPVCVLQVGFLSNEEEESRIVTEEYQRKAVKGIADGIDRYFN